MRVQRPNLLASTLRNFFSDYLPRLRGVSPHTIQSYRDSLVLLLRFLASRENGQFVDLDLMDLSAPAIVAFLAHLEQERKVSTATRNVRLAAIHAFSRFLAALCPDQLDLAQRILGIPFKRTRKRAVEYLMRKKSRRFFRPSTAPLDQVGATTSYWPPCSTRAVASRKLSISGLATSSWLHLSRSGSSVKGVRNASAPFGLRPPACCATLRKSDNWTFGPKPAFSSTTVNNL